jgi:3-hydroxyisobutyrate dehydrogenase
MKVGIAGIGKMGAAIATRLIEVGHELTVWNRTPEKAKAVDGAKITRTPAELAQTSEVVISILTDAAALDAVYNGPSGLLQANVAGKLFIDMSTVLPASEIALAGSVRGKGAGFVECPVGGSTGPARQGKLIGLMGAEATDAARARPLLEQLCRRLEHAGTVGSGSVLKFTINLPLMVYWQALGEALAMARSDGSSQRHVRSGQCPQSARPGDRVHAQGRLRRSGHFRCRQRHQRHAIDARRSQIARHRTAAGRAVAWLLSGNQTAPLGQC